MDITKKIDKEGRIRVMYRDSDEVMICDGLVDDQTYARLIRRSGEEYTALEVPLKKLRADSAKKTNAVVLDSKFVEIVGVYSAGGTGINKKMFKRYENMFKRANLKWQIPKINKKN